MKFEMDHKTKYFFSVAMCCSNYGEFLNIDSNIFANILGIIYAKHQDNLRNISPQGLALLLCRLIEIEEKDYGKYIYVLKDKVDKIIEEKSLIKEQVDEVKKLKIE